MFMRATSSTPAIMSARRDMSDLLDDFARASAHVPGRHPGAVSPLTSGHDDDKVLGMDDHRHPNRRVGLVDPRRPWVRAVVHPADQLTDRHARVLEEVVTDV